MTMSASSGSLKLTLFFNFPLWPLLDEAHEFAEISKEQLQLSLGFDVEASVSWSISATLLLVVDDEEDKDG